MVEGVVSARAANWMSSRRVRGGSVAASGCGISRPSIRIVSTLASTSRDAAMPVGSTTDRPRLVTNHSRRFSSSTAPRWPYQRGLPASPSLLFRNASGTGPPGASRWRWRSEGVIPSSPARVPVHSWSSPSSMIAVTCSRLWPSVSRAVANRPAWKRVSPSAPPSHSVPSTARCHARTIPASSPLPGSYSLKPPSGSIRASPPSLVDSHSVPSRAVSIHVRRAR